VIRISDSQSRLLFGSKPKATRAPRKRTSKAEQPENIVEAQVLDFLRAHGWLCIRQQVGTFVAYYNYANKIQNAPVVRVGEKGATDWLALRPIIGNRTTVEMFYLELKAPGASIRPEQAEWIRKRRAIGLEADWFDCFDSGRQPFEPWYRARFS